ncbi:hypothetical protein ACFCZ6_02955 [Streptomyces hydrogenans]|uniref:hypothetical protein n=1 Tax=Streptomyces hydrogenans TaxID=1873719 RepID=UPI0035DC865B
MIAPRTCSAAAPSSAATSRVGTCQTSRDEQYLLDPRVLQPARSAALAALASDVDQVRTNRPWQSRRYGADGRFLGGRPAQLPAPHGAVTDAFADPAVA